MHHWFYSGLSHSAEVELQLCLCEVDKNSVYCWCDHGGRESRRTGTTTFHNNVKRNLNQLSLLKKYDCPPVTEVIIVKYNQIAKRKGFILPHV